MTRERSNRPCPSCEGSGWVPTPHSDTLAERAVCGHCQGSGELPATPRAFARTPAPAPEVEGWEYPDGQSVRVPATLFHDAGAIARCSYCWRYTLDARALRGDGPMCDCGKRGGWTGSFVAPDASAEWAGRKVTCCTSDADAASAPDVDWPSNHNRTRMETVVMSSTPQGGGQPVPPLASDLSGLTVEEVQRLTQQRDDARCSLAATEQVCREVRGERDRWRTFGQASLPVLEAAQERGADAAYWHDAQAVLALFPGEK